MKKVLSMAMLAAMMLGMTSCLGSGDENIQTLSIYMYNFVVDENNSESEPTLTQAFSGFEVNMSKLLVTGDIKAASNLGMATSFTFGPIDMKIGQQSYDFTKSLINTQSQSIINLQGSYDPGIRAMTVDYLVDGDYHVYSTASYAYNFANMKVYKSTDEFYFDDDEVAFEFIPDCSTKKLDWHMVNFVRTPNDVPVALYYKSLPFTLTRDGKIVVKQSNALKSTEFKDEYEISDLDIVIDVKANKASCSFVMDERKFQLAGEMFTPVSN